MTAVIRTNSLSRWYGNVLGLNDVSLDIETGITGLLGPNGAGKSTFMKLVTGQMKASSGRASVFGGRVWNNPPLFRRIGFCPEQDAFHEGVTGWEFVKGLLELQGFSGREAADRAFRALEFVEMLPDKDRRIRSYSRGMRQRVKIAQSLAHDPDLLILDEPLNGLDPLGKRKVIRLIKDFQAAGRTILVSSHVLPEIEAMTTRIVLIHQGRILAEGDIHYIRDLIEGHPHVISVECSDPRRLAEILVREEDIARLQFGADGRTVVFETHARDKVFSRLPRLFVDNGIAVESITSPDDNLQSVFDYLVGK